MSIVLSIETSTNICSVSFFKDGKVLSTKEITKGQSHASQINYFIEEVLLESNFRKNDIQAVALSAGPGSYTGLRIGTSTAKGLCYALDIPLITINSLEIMAVGLLEQEHIDEDTLLMPVIDARRMEVFTAIYDNKMNNILATQPFVLDKAKIDLLKKDKNILVFGNATEKSESVFGNDNYSYNYKFLTSSKYMLSIAEAKFSKKDFSSIPYFEPFYAKAFHSQ